MANPYEPAAATDAPAGTRDWERNQCPYCLHRQSVWNAINSLRTYLCDGCDEPLIVTLSPRWSRVVAAMALVAVGAFLACHYIFGIQLPGYVAGFGLVLIASSLVLRYCFGYFHPTGRQWILTRRELAIARSTNQSENSG